jgi:2-keto-4-pentenoate hydratase
MTEPVPEPVAAASRRLALAAESGTPCAPVRDLIGATDIAAAYAVQGVRTRRRLADGGRIVGRKIGLTSPAVQRQLGVDQPDFGVLFADMDVSSFEEIPFDGLLQPRAEAEIAFVLGEDLVDGDFDDDAWIRAAVDYGVAALEIVDSRIAGWDITIADTVADNASSALFVLADRRLTLKEFEPREVTMRLRANGDPVSEGSGAACLGDPLAALAWLARAVRDLGEPLRAGEIVLSGALGPMVSVSPGDVLAADISGLGSVTAAFCSGGRR